MTISPNAITVLERRYLIKDDTIKLDTSDEIVRSILVTLDGEIVHAGTKEAMGIA